MAFHLVSLNRCLHFRTVNLISSQSLKSLAGGLLNQGCIANQSIHMSAGLCPYRTRLVRSELSTTQKRSLDVRDYRIPNKNLFEKDGIPKDYDIICNLKLYRPHLLLVKSFIFALVKWQVLLLLAGTSAMILTVYILPEEFPKTLFGYEIKYFLGGSFVILLLCVTVIQSIHAYMNLLRRLYHNRKTGDFIAISKMRKLKFKSHEIAGTDKFLCKWRGNFVIKGHYFHVNNNGFSATGTMSYYNKWCGME